MKCRIMHESSKRLRVHVIAGRMTLRQADILQYYLSDLDFVHDVKVYDRTGDAVIIFKNNTKNHQALVSALAMFSYDDEHALSLVPDHTGRALNRAYEEKLTMMIVGRGLRRLFLPAPVNMVITIVQSIKFIRKGLSSLLRGKLEVSVLDATAIVTSMVRGDFATAGSVMFLLNVGDILEEWTHRKSVDDLAKSMSLKVDKVWKTAGDHNELVAVKSVRKGDHIVLSNSNVIPLDGKVISGHATVNQASMTGESVPVAKSAGGYVYAGTVVEDGRIIVEVTKELGAGSYDKIVRMIENTEKLKSAAETEAYQLADKLVPYSLLGTVITYALTRNVNRAISFLMVDFSCALKLSMPLSVLSALNEASRHQIVVKGGKFLEALAQADTVVFDKTGTLTHASPQVVGVDAYGKNTEENMLRIAACLEEHYPHSLANAVVKAAKDRGITHDEMHSSVKYVVAHGIESTIDDKRVMIGSYHFVFEDNKCTIPEGEEERFHAMAPEYTHLYLAIDGQLAAVIHIFDELRSEARDVIDELHQLGIAKVCMMTGDNEDTAAAIAKKLNIDEYHAEVLPADKANFIAAEHEKGRKVIMVGDGVNDAPALSQADCGIAVSEGAAIAQEVADIVITSDGLKQLLYLRKLSAALMKRINSNYHFIIAFNSALIALGVSGILLPANAALLHNGSTLITGLNSMTPLLKEDTKKQAVA